jgi:hypothetical protein
MPMPKFRNSKSVRLSQCVTRCGHDSMARRLKSAQPARDSAAHSPWSNGKFFKRSAAIGLSQNGTPGM